MINERFRLKVALAGAVAEVQCEKRLVALREAGVFSRYEHHDMDNYPDFTIWLSEEGPELKVEVKNVRNYKAGYREGGEIIAYMVELQKTRRGADESSRFYDVDRFDIVAVCLGKKTGNYENFLFARTTDLRRHDKYPDKLAAMQRLPLPGTLPEPSLIGEADLWYDGLEDLLRVMRGVEDE
jgi:hypothetical protein